MKVKFRNLRFPLFVAAVIGLAIGLIFLGLSVPANVNYTAPDSTVYPDTYGYPTYQPFVGRNYSQGEFWLYLGFLIVIMSIIVIFAFVQAFKNHMNTEHLRQAQLKAKKKTKTRKPRDSQQRHLSLEH